MRSVRIGSPNQTEDPQFTLAIDKDVAGSFGNLQNAHGLNSMIELTAGMRGDNAEFEVETPISLGGNEMRRRSHERGSALILAILVMFSMVALGVLRCALREYARSG